MLVQRKGYYHEFNKFDGIVQHYVGMWLYV